LGEMSEEEHPPQPIRDKLKEVKGRLTQDVIEQVLGSIGERFRSVYLKHQQDKALYFESSVLHSIPVRPLVYLNVLERASFVASNVLSGDEFTDQIEVKPQENASHHERKIQIPLRKDQLMNGGYAVMVLPTDYRCSNPDTVSQIKAGAGQDFQEVFDGNPWRAMMGRSPELYKRDEWSAKANDFIVMHRLGSSLYLRRIRPFQDEIEPLERRKFGEDGEDAVILQRRIFLESETEVPAELNMMRNSARLYRLHEVDNSSELVGSHFGPDK